MMTSLKGILLAGGTGSRLSPLTNVTNKHLLPVGKKPMIFYPVEQFVRVGITDILVVTGREHMGDILNLLGSGADFKCSFTYRVQDRAGGIAEALALAKNFVGDSRMMVMLGDNIFEKSLHSSLVRFLEQPNGARILLKEVEQPERFGVAEIAAGKVVRIVEKPQHAPSRLAVTGAYFYDSAVFDVIRRLKPSARDEFEITDVNMAYANVGTLHYDVVDGWWSDAGTFESLAKVNQLLAEGEKS